MVVFHQDVDAIRGLESLGKPFDHAPVKRGGVGIGTHHLGPVEATFHSHIRVAIGPDMPASVVHLIRGVD